MKHKVRARPLPGVHFDAVQADWLYNAYARSRVDAATAMDKKGPTQVTLASGDDQTITAGPAIVGNTCSEGNSQATVVSLTPDLVSVNLHEFGSVIAKVPPGTNASAFASSTGKIGVIGGTRMRNGQIEWEAHAAISQTVSGSAHAFTGPAYKDPLVARKHDRTTGETLVKTLLSIEAEPLNGDLLWEDDTLRSHSSNFRFKMSMDSPWTAQNGVLVLEVNDGIVTTADAAGDIDNALIFDVNTNQWQPLVDPSTEQPVGLSFQLFGTGDQF